jgi:hypothetical protein
MIGDRYREVVVSPRADDPQAVWRKVRAEVRVAGGPLIRVKPLGLATAAARACREWSAPKDRFDFQTAGPSI